MTGATDVFTELPWLYTGLAAYALATLIAIRGVIVMRNESRAIQATLQPQTAMVVKTNRSHENLVIALIVAGVVLLAIALAQRWLRIGHGPFINLFELLISQLFSLGLIFSLAYWRIPVIRTSAIVVLPALWILGIWVLLLEPTGGPLPPTYYNKWLWVHVGVGKIFLSCSLIGTGLAGVILMRGSRYFSSLFHAVPDDKIISNIAWRFMFVAFIFESLMLIAGAVWAQDAWGRYWAWDALETSAFLNWLVLGAAIHARLTYRVPVRVGAVVIVGVFIFAFMTYFGTPFLSNAAHKGVI